MLLEGQRDARETVFPRPVKLSVSADQLRENMNYALSLGLPSIRPGRAHDGVLAIAGGGPSLADTYRKLKHPGPKTRVAAVNGSHDYLLSKDIVPHFCGLMDPAPHLADLISPRAAVTYFVASTCDRAVFDKLKGYDVRLWHASGQLEDEQDILNRDNAEWVMVGGGSTISLRWIVLAHIMGFRSFRLHGFDSCLSGQRRHAYDQDDGEQPEPVEHLGFHTSPQWLTQVADFFGMLAKLSEPGNDHVTIKMHGDGLLQTEFKRFRKECGRELFN